ncbi:MAG TPA: hypothetical protein VHD62_09605 [Opitutaceae bacterium]|nr:hypothetical protein [Opitutaceae bacterium]
MHLPSAPTARPNLASDEALPLKFLAGLWLPVADAARLAGVPEWTLYDWNRRGKLQFRPGEAGRHGMALDYAQLVAFLLSPEAGKFQLRPQRLPRAKLHCDPRVNLRPEPEPADFQRYRDARRRGDSLPPIIAAILTGRLVVVDGLSRLAVYDAEGVTVVEVVEVPIASPAQAAYLNLRLNQRHGRGYERIGRQVVKTWLRAEPPLLEAVLKGEITHRSFALSFGLADSTVYRAFQDLKSAGAGGAPHGLNIPDDWEARTADMVRLLASSNQGPVQVRVARLASAIVGAADLFTAAHGASPSQFGALLRKFRGVQP